MANRSGPGDVQLIFSPVGERARIEAIDHQTAAQMALLAAFREVRYGLGSLGSLYFPNKSDKLHIYLNLLQMNLMRPKSFIKFYELTRLHQPLPIHYEICGII